MATPSGPVSNDADGYPGARLGLPAQGPLSMAGLGRRVPALVIDWFACLAIARFVFGGIELGSGGNGNLLPLAIFFVENVVLVATVGSTLGHRILGLQVVAVGRPTLSPVQSLVRAALLCLVIPAAVWDADGRGLHDKAAGTAIVRR